MCGVGSIALIASSLAGCGPVGPAARARIGAGVRKVVCVNRASGAAWTVSLDETRRIADGQTARFSEAKIAWRNPADGGNYELDRRSGALSVTRASSTGGYMIFFDCAPPSG
jgi:hypothetical protein